MNHRCSRFARTSVLIAGFIATAPSLARAQDAPADPRIAEVKRACAAGEVERGIKLLADMYAENSDINAVYNQGRCYQQNGRREEAITRFQEYLRRAGAITFAERAEVEAFIKDMQAELDARKAKGDPKTTETKVDTKDTGEPDSRGRGLRIGGMVAAGVGVAAIATGIAMGLRAQSKQTAAESNVAAGRSYDPNLDSAGRSAETLQWVGYGVGAAGVLIGATLYYLGWRQGEATTTQVAALPVPGGAVAMAKVSF
jgi:hypothetical protein